MIDFSDDSTKFYLGGFILRKSLIQVFVYHKKTYTSGEEEDGTECAMIGIIHNGRAKKEYQCKEI